MGALILGDAGGIMHPWLGRSVDFLRDPAAEPGDRGGSCGNHSKGRRRFRFAFACSCPVMSEHQLEDTGWAG